MFLEDTQKQNPWGLTATVFVTLFLRATPLTGSLSAAV